MISLKHPFCNGVLTRPAGMTEQECRNLHVYHETTTPEQPFPAVSSFWTPEPAELESLNSGGSVMLRIIGHTHPPLSVRVSPKNDDAAPASGYVPFIMTTDEFNSICDEVVKLREEVKNWKTLESVHTNGDGDPATPESVIAHLKYLQEEWDTAETRIGKLNAVLRWHKEFSMRVLSLLFGKDYQAENLETLRSLVAAEMPERDTTASITEWLEQRSNEIISKAHAAATPTGFNYLAVISGGIGPDVWDTELTISAVDFMDAANQAAAAAKEANGNVINLEQSA